MKEASNDRPDQSPRQARRAGAGVVSLALNSAEKVYRAGEDIMLRRVMRSPAFEARQIVDDQAIDNALELEQRVWQEEKFGDLGDYDYDKYLPQSSVFAAFDGDKCIGMSRIFTGHPEVPPFLDKEKQKKEHVLPFYDEQLRDELIRQGHELKAEEFGTIAIERGYRGGRVLLDLCRLAWRDASDRGIQTWGIIMAPERVEQMNRLLGFTFHQVGGVIDYQGGRCAAHIMDFDEVRHNMSSTRPELYNWFVNEPL